MNKSDQKRDSWYGSHVDEELQFSAGAIGKPTTLRNSFNFPKTTTTVGYTCSSRTTVEFLYPPTPTANVRLTLGIGAQTVTGSNLAHRWTRSESCVERSWVAFVINGWEQDELAGSFTDRVIV